MFVAGFIGGINAIDLDRQLKRRFGGVLTVDREFSANFIEPSVNPTDAEVAGFEADRGVYLIIGIDVGRRTELGGNANNRSDHEC